MKRNHFDDACEKIRGMTIVDSSTPVPNMLQHVWKSVLVSGILSVILGVMVLAWPGKTILLAAILLGLFLLVSGIAQVVLAFALHVSASGRVLLFISGAASLILAMLAFRHFGRSEADAVLLLAIWIGVGFIFRGVSTFASAISDPTLPGRGWNIFFGVVTLIAGLIMMASPLESLVTLTLVVGVWLIVSGVFEAMSAFAMRKAATAAKPSPPITPPESSATPTS